MIHSGTNSNMHLDKVTAIVKHRMIPWPSSSGTESAEVPTIAADEEVICWATKNLLYRGPYFYLTCITCWFFFYRNIVCLLWFILGMKIYSRLVCTVRFRNIIFMTHAHNRKEVKLSLGQSDKLTEFTFNKFLLFYLFVFEVDKTD